MSIELSPVDVNDIPTEVARELSYFGARYTRMGEIGLSLFTDLFVVDGGDATTYIGRADKVLIDGTKEATIQAIDAVSSRPVGYGEVRLVDSPHGYYEDKPFVGDTNTESSLRGRGLGTQRLYKLGAACWSLFEAQLHSGDVITHRSVHSIWQTCVSDGIAETFQEPAAPYRAEVDRYRFIPGDDLDLRSLLDSASF